LNAAQLFGMALLQTPRSVALVFATEFFSGGRIVARPLPIAH
jgi:hypothetical protein